MTNHHDATDPADHGPDSHGPDSRGTNDHGPDGQGSNDHRPDDHRAGDRVPDGHVPDERPATADNHPAHGSAHTGAAPAPDRPARLIDCPDFDAPVKLRSAAEMADALPYILGYRPEDCVVLLALHRQEGYSRFAGRVRLGIPKRTEDWRAVADELARCLVIGSARRGSLPDAVVVFVCREPRGDGTGPAVMEGLRPLAQYLRRACGGFGVPVVEALCLSAGRYWSYCCPDERCCPAEGTAMGLPGSSVLAAAAAYAGIRVRGPLRELRARLTPWEGPAAREQESALDTARARLMPDGGDRTGLPDAFAATLALARTALNRLGAAPRDPDPTAADGADDALFSHDEAAALIIGLQDRDTRDAAAEWMEGPDGEAALRLWRTLARRCVGPYADHAAAPLSLAGWVAWSTGDGLEAREALAMALAADPDYLFARLLHRACNDGLSIETMRECIRQGGQEREAARARAADAPRGPQPDRVAPAPRSARTAAALRRGKARQRAAGGARGPLPSGPPTRPGTRPRPAARPRPVASPRPVTRPGPGRPTEH
ncbi:DUF4192 domain-containing protein [Streptomyces sp. NPDC059816]|uniref:DUF4192 domain-containing protein n=1 Tax=Streptomyces sp. NPDC059816 TaxID=3346960 RepID=UPI00365DE326